MNNAIKNDLQLLAQAQHAFETNGWFNVGAVQRELYSNSINWGTIFEKNGKRFFLNIDSASKALQLLKRE